MTDKIKTFEHGSGDWEKLYNFMDENDFSCADFLACICAHLTENELKLAWQIFTTTIMVAGVKFKITIEPEFFGKERKYNEK